MNNSFGYTNDKLKKSKGFIDQNDILKYVSEKEIYSLVFGFEPVEYQYVTSPLREDDDAGCWFEYSDNKLFFRDFAYSNRPLDCFHVVKDYFKIKTFPATLQFIKEQFIDNQNRTVLTQYIREDKEKFYMDTYSRQFLVKDANYWKPYGISRDNLISDSVFALSRAKLYNSKSGDLTKHYFNTIAYAYTEFKDGKKKIYTPYEDVRFITDCTKNDIGSIKHLPPFGRLLIITKSYKDCRVIRNQGYNSVWFQNEGMIPSDDILYNLCKRFTHVIILYDNDARGITSSIDLKNKINQYFVNKSKCIYVVEKESVNDPSDLVKEDSEYELKKFLKENENFR